jgi:hypothetical protein
MRIEIQLRGEPKVFTYTTNRPPYFTQNGVEITEAADGSRHYFSFANLLRMSRFGVPPDEYRKESR